MRAEYYLGSSFTPVLIRKCKKVDSSDFDQLQEEDEVFDEMAYYRRQDLIKSKYYTNDRELHKTLYL